MQAVSMAALARVNMEVDKLRRVSVIMFGFLNHPHH
jgi:hypothetical protein